MKDKLAVVGIGASAGGLEALRQLLEKLPPDLPVALVVVVHLSPTHESHLAELLQQKTQLTVQQVTQDTLLAPRRVYVIPPGRNLAAVDSHLRLLPLEQRHGERAQVDHFLRTLANTHDGHSIGIVLSGTGSDGVLGLQAIRARGGLTIAQEPSEAQFDGMPQSAIAAGTVDLVLRVAEMPAAIDQFLKSQPALDAVAARDDETSRQLLQKVFAQIRSRTGRDFTRYKPSTILRRVTRRMQLKQVETLERYLEVLREDADEVAALADDLLINVTSFFREREVFEHLRSLVVPGLLAARDAQQDVRVWSVGCATGEEAYSLAILFIEEAQARSMPPRVQVFASDLQAHALRRAREGFYPGDIAADVGAERLRRFFTQEQGGYRIKPEVRERVVFAPHNLLADPPFSRLDLICCRNLLIYLQREAQREVLELFHYALRPDGVLLLGSSETIDGSDLFTVLDKRACLYRKRKSAHAEIRLPVFPMSRLAMPQGERPPREEHNVYAAMHQRLLERHGPPSLLLGPDDRIVHLTASAGRYLLHPGGEVTNNVLRLVREELRLDLRAALTAVRGQPEPVRTRPISLTIGGTSVDVVLEVRTVHEWSGDGFVMVGIEESAVAPRAEEQVGDATAAPNTKRLESELAGARHRLQVIVSDYEASREEMKAANEELQSTNEELRSTMEELETSREELQSMNEELQTVNQENRHKVEELALLTSDLQNLLAATDIATLFLDRELRIMRFTPKLGELFNVRLTDRGRPISDITHRLGYDGLRRDAEAVLQRLVPVEREVRDEAQRCYLTRLLPYRSVEDHIQGIVITFVDITERKRNEENLRLADQRKEEFLATLAHELRSPLAALANGLNLLEMAGADPKVGDEARRLMKRQLGQLLRLVDDLIDADRITRGKLALQRRRCSLQAVVEQAVETIRPLLAERRLDVELPREPVTLHADAARLCQVFANLLSHACRSTPAGGSIRLRGEVRGGELVVEVVDDGGGIAKEAMHDLFTTFGERSRVDAGSGTGLGIEMALVKRLVDLHGGTVAVHSDGLGCGSTFVVTIPLLADAGR